VSTSSIPIAFAVAAQAVERVIAIVDQVLRRLVPRKRLVQLLGRPRAKEHFFNLLAVLGAYALHAQPGRAVRAVVRGRGC
jgi:hypothetical protein